MIWLLIACWIPVPVEAWPERKGESKKSKTKDAILLALYALVLSLLGWKFEQVNPLKTVALILSFRILSFDYIVHALLKKYSERHKHINIWTYMGESTHWWDQAVNKIHPGLRLVIRLALFLAALWWFV